MPNTISVNLKKNENGKKNDFEIEKYFCPTCLQYPEYTIIIKNNGSIYLSHLCSENKTISEGLTEIKGFKSSSNEKVCVNCKNIATNICLKCGEFICDKCLIEHQSTKGLLNNDNLKVSIFPILSSQYYCKNHLNKVTHFCRYCKINLCDKECLLGHYHYKNELLNIRIKMNPSGYNGENVTLKGLADLSKSFNECYEEGVKNSNLTLNIIHNYYLIEPINGFIKANKNNKGKIKEETISSKFKKAEGESYYIFDLFANEDFNKYYFKLIMNAQKGNIRAFHKLMEIRKRYISLRKYKNEIISFKQNYIIALNLSIVNQLDELFLNFNFKAFRDFPLILFNLNQKINDLERQQNQLLLDLESIKKFVISIDFIFDFDLRRKVGNMISGKMLNLYVDKLDKIEMTEYLLALAIEDIETKIAKTNLSEMPKENKKNALKNLKDKYTKGLQLLKDITSNKLKNINLDNIKFPKSNYSYKFMNKTNNEKEILEMTVLNLFFIVKKKLNEAFNASIQNKSMKLNYLVKEELEKNKKENELKINEEKIKNKKTLSPLKNENDNQIENTIETESENFIKRKENIKNNIKEENEKSHFTKTCKNRKIFFVKERVKIEDNSLDQKSLLINEFLAEKEEINAQSYLYEFYEHLKESATIFDINSNLNFDLAIKLFLTGEKSEMLIPLNKDEDKKAGEKEDNERIKIALSNSEKSQSFEEIKEFLKWISGIIDDNIKSIKYFRKKSLDFIEDYGEFFDIELIMKQFDLSLPLNLWEINNTIKRIEKSSIEVDFYEKSLYICHIYAFLYYDEFYGFYYKIKDKIKDLNLDIFLLNEAKNYLIKEAKDALNSISFEERLIENVWENLKSEKKLIQNINIDKNIKEYIKNKNISTFMKDLNVLFGEKIKDINLKNADPQNIFLKPFMKQNELYYDMQ